MAQLDEVFDEHLKHARHQNTVPNKLLECTLAVVRERVVDEVKSANYVTV